MKLAAAALCLISCTARPLGWDVDGSVSVDAALATTDAAVALDLTMQPGVCIGAPLPAEICTAEGWRCDTSRALMLCPSVACATCAGFVGPADNLACACLCSGGQVRCGPSD